MPQTATPHGGRRRRRWAGHGRLLLAFLVAGGVTTGALAATGVLRVTSEPSPDELGLAGLYRSVGGPGKIDGKVTILPWRIKDPHGGPPWTMRVFETTREGACAQAGQVYRGQFGHIEDDGRGDPVFRIASNAPTMAMGMYCGTPTKQGFPAFSGIHTARLVGGVETSERCRSKVGHRDPCPIKAVTVLRFGMLGPEARSVTAQPFATAASRAGGPGSPTPKPRTMKPGLGGAYLFVDGPDPMPWREAEIIGARARDDIDAKYPRRSQKGLTRAERRAEARRWLRRNKYVSTRIRQDSARMSNLIGAQNTGVFVAATFADGTKKNVIGTGAFDTPIPGVELQRPPIVRGIKTKVSAEYRGRLDPIRVTFPSPVALDRMQRSYWISMTGPRPPQCGKPRVTATQGYARNKAKGAIVPVDLYAPQTSSKRVAWCPGATYEISVRLDTLVGPRGGHVKQPLGKGSLRIP